MRQSGAGRGRLLAAVSVIPTGRVATIDVVCAHCGMDATLAITLLQRLSDDERQALPWHRVVAKGGAIGRGPWRETQFARLVREGVVVSPAGVVQDLARMAISPADLALTPGSGAQRSREAAVSLPEKAQDVPVARSRGMRQAPGS